jgi:carbon monoxide dehydrogenase subunit G
MSLVTVSTQIAVSPQDVWRMIMDPERLGDWVTIHRRLIHADEGPPRVGYEMDQQLHLRGVNLEVHWKLIDCRTDELAIWEGRGPARSHARTEYILSADGDGTRFDYRNEFRAPLGPLGAIVSRALVGGMPEREAKRTLVRLRANLEGRLPGRTSVR